MSEQNQDIKNYALETLLVSIANKSTSSFVELNETFDTPLQEINHVLIKAMNDLSKLRFNGIVDDWVDRFLGEDKKKIVSANSLETILNYLTYLKDKGYSSERTIVSVSDNKIVIEMKDGCPYSTFCGKHDKCIRGRVFKHLQSKYVPVLDKTNYPSCSITLESMNNALDDVFESISCLEGDIYII